MREAQYLDEIRQAWDRLNKEGAPTKSVARKRKCERGKGLMGRSLIEVIAFAARDAGMILLRKSPHRRSFYLKGAGSQFKLRISDHAYSKHSEERHLAVILNFIAPGPMDSKDAIAKGRALVDEYKRLRDERSAEAAGCAASAPSPDLKTSQRPTVSSETPPLPLNPPSVSGQEPGEND